MESGTKVIYYIGWILFFLGGWGVLVKGFRENFWWGIAMIFIPIFPFAIFVILNWKETYKPILCMAIGLGIMFLATYQG